ncbi:MAG: protein translocase subunit SecF [Saprospiraceae bacterium]
MAVQRSRTLSFESGFFALLLIFLYLFIRFSKWEFSLGAVLALFHDVIITLGMFSLLWGIVPFTMEIDQALVAAILTVIGYSVNDTVIVFDRIREFINTYAGKSKEDIFNLAINNTLSRTLITSCTTLFVVLILFIFGGGSIKGFAFALLIGILVGTYSSIFVASATVVDLVKDIKVKAVEKKKEGSFTRAKAQS